MSQSTEEVNKPVVPLSKADSLGAKNDSLDDTGERMALDMELPPAVPVDEVEEEISHGGRKVKRRGVYLLPNMVTTGALFGGFYAIIAAMNADFASAALAIFIAQLLDGVDGRVARMTGAESAFGVQYDSLSDMVSFGLAPAIVMFSFALEPLGKYGWAAGFIFAVCAALRLARFNTQSETVDKRFFTGLASPPAATLMASAVWLGSSYEVTTGISVFAAVVTAFVGLLMISNIPFYSFKTLDQNRRVPFVSFFITAMVCLAVMVNPPLVLFTLAFTYAAHGPVMYCLKLFRRKSTGGASL